MKSIILFFKILFFFCGVVIKSQTINGRIVNSTDEGIAYAEVSLIKEQIKRNTLSNDKGNYEISVPEKGIYKLSVIKDGKEILNKEINISEDKTENLVLGLKETQIQTVHITGKKKLIERKIDRLIFNVESSISASGGDILDALKITPNLRVQNDQISMIGKNNMSVMIDERLVQLSGDELMSFLKTIKADDVKSIEVITNPPAKYDAEGNSGIVNIQLKKAKKNNISGSLKSSYTQATYALGNLGGSLNYQKNKLTILSSLNYNNGSTSPYQEYTIDYPTYTWFEKNITRNFQNSISGRLNLDYEISKKTKMGIEYFGIFSSPLQNGNNTSNIVRKTTGVLDSIIVTPSRIETERRTHSVNFHSITKLDTLGKSISIDADYFNYTSSMNNIFNTNTYLPNGNSIPGRYLSANNINRQNVDIYSAKIDYDLPLQWINLSFGGKVAFIKNNSGVSYFDTTSTNPVFNADKSNEFQYKENTQAIYVSGNKKLFENWDVQFGLRLESTQTKGYSITLNQNTENNYSKLFPSFNLTYKLNEDNTFGFNYSKRIDRPAYSKLNPFRFYSSSYNYSEGNPFLQPFFTDNAEISYIYKNLYSAVYGSYLKNGYDEVTFVYPSSIIQIVKPTNFYTQKTIGLIENYTFNRWKFWESNNQINIYYSQTTSDNVNTVPYLENWTASLSSNNNFNLNSSKTVKAELNFTYQSPSLAGSYKLSEFYYFDMGFKFLFLKNKFQIAANFMDVFRTSKMTFIQVINGIEQRNFDYQDTQKFRISLLWNFGKTVKSEKRQQSNDEEKTRTN